MTSTNGTLQAMGGRRDGQRGRELAAMEPWFHNLHLPGGVETAPDHPLGDFPTFKWRQIADHIPDDLTDWTVLDIGCNAGFYSFELAKRGALVDAIDVDPHYLQQASWAAAQLGMAHRVRFRQATVFELLKDPQRYDLVWFMGVFYHLRYPLLGLDIAVRKARTLMVFQTLTLPGAAGFEAPDNLPYEKRSALSDSEWPRMAFVEKAFAGDPSNWWVPDRSAVEGLLRTAGVQDAQLIADETWICRLPPHGRTTPPELEILQEEGR